MRQRPKISAGEALGPDELDRLFAPFAQTLARPCALAVSGGGDSTALMVLVAEWLRRAGSDPSRHAVLTVDHGLRPEAAAEARSVAARAAALGFAHATLPWRSEKPATGIQAAARSARYALMGEYVRRHGLAALLTAHTLDDQVETLLMRLARGSGLDGLAAMAPSARLGGLLLLRPLLEVPKARLLATLAARGISWIEDPSNQSPAFERTRLRAVRAGLEPLGLAGPAPALSARRLRRARSALEAVTDDVCAEAAGLVHTDPCGAFAVNRVRLGGLPEEIALRVLARCIAAAGGLRQPPPLAKLEAIGEALRAEAGARASWTLGRAGIAAGTDAVTIGREPGREPLPRLTVEAGAEVLWDGRFAVRVGRGIAGSVEVGAVGREGVAELRRLGHAAGRSRPLQLAAAFRRRERLLAVPAVGFWADPGLERALSAEFVGLRYNSSAAGDGLEEPWDWW